MADDSHYLGPPNTAKAAFWIYNTEKLLPISPVSTGFKELREKVISGSLDWRKAALCLCM